MELDQEIQAAMGMKEPTYIVHSGEGWRGGMLANREDQLEWWEWTSPNGVVHIVPGNHPCATCGGHHDRPHH